MRTKKALCPECDGEGGILIGWGPDEYDGIICDRCDGDGVIEVEHPDGDFVWLGKKDA